MKYKIFDDNGEEIATFESPIQISTGDYVFVEPLGEYRQVVLKYIDPKLPECLLYVDVESDD